MRIKVPKHIRAHINVKVASEGYKSGTCFDICRFLIHFWDKNNGYIKSSYTLWLWRDILKWIKKIVGNFKQNTNKDQFEDLIQQACQYKIFEFDI